MNKNNDILASVLLYKNEPSDENKNLVEEKLHNIIYSIIKRYNVENINNAYNKCWKLIIEYIDKIEIRNYEEIMSIVSKTINKVKVEIIAEKECTYTPIHMRETIEKYLAIKKEKGFYPQDEEVANIMNLSIDKVKQIRKIAEKLENKD